MKHYTAFSCLILFMCFTIPGFSGFASTLPFHCEKDSMEIRELIESLSSDPKSKRGDRILKAAESLYGKGADDSLTTDSLAGLRLNVDTFTPMSFVNTCIALAVASDTPGASWRTYSDKLKNFSCRKGENDGFVSLFYHTSDWIGDNIYRGNFTELTDRFQGARSKTMSLDYLTANRERFPALANPDAYDRVRMQEFGFRSHKVPFLPKQAISSKDVLEDLRDGDIVILISDKDRSDFFKFGIVKLEADGPHLIHFDEKQGKVVKESEPMKRYFNLMTKYFSGFRIVRVL